MKRSSIKLNDLIETVGIEVIFHTIFFYIRIILFGILKLIARQISLERITLVNISSDIIFSFQFSVFQLYFLLKSLITANVYGYYLGAILIFHNFALTTTILTIVQLTLSAKYYIVGFLISGSYLLEFIFAIFMIVLKSREREMQLFRTIGVDPNLNKVYSTRMKLQTFGDMNVFLSMVIPGRFFLPPAVSFFWIDYLSIGIFVITAIQQLLISVRFNDENRKQRQMAIAVSVFKALFTVVMLVFIAILPYPRNVPTEEVNLVIYSDILIANIALMYYMTEDMKYFGSGLKDSIKIRTRMLVLSH